MHDVLESQSMPTKLTFPEFIQFDFFNESSFSAIKIVYECCCCMNCFS